MKADGPGKFLMFLVLLLPVAMGLRAERHFFSNLSLADGLSQITVTAIHQDSQGYMWFGTRNGLNRYDGYGFTIYSTGPDSPAPISDNHILAIAEDGDHNLWVGTNYGLTRLDLQRGGTRIYTGGTEGGSLTSEIVSSVLYDSRGRLWVGTNYGLNLYDPHKDTFIHIYLDGLLSGTRIYTMMEYGGQLYIGTASRGLVVYDHPTGRYENFRHDPEDPGSIAHNNIRSIITDRHGNLWVGTHQNGVSLRRKGEKEFRTINTSNGLTHNYVRCISESPEGKIVIGTFNGLTSYNPASEAVENYRTYSRTTGDLSHYSIFSLCFDSAGTLWVGTYAGGIDYSNPAMNIFRHYDPAMETGSMLSVLGPMAESGEKVYFASEGGGLICYDRQRHTYRQFRPVEHRNDYYVHEVDNIIKSVYREGNILYCGTYGGKIYRFDILTERFTLWYDIGMESQIYYLGRLSTGDMAVCTVGHRGLILISPHGQARYTFILGDGSERNFSNVRSVLEVSPEVLLLGTRNNGIFRFDIGTGELREYTHTDQPGSLPENYVTSIIKSEDGEIWVTTFGGGLSMMNPGTGEFTTYGIADGLSDLRVCSIVEYLPGKFALSTIQGISLFDKTTGIFANYSHYNGIGIEEFTPHSGDVLKDGMVVFSGNNGFVMFNPGDIRTNNVIPPVKIGSITVNNTPVMPADGTGILGSMPEWSQSIVLGHNQSNLTIGFSALNYIFSDRNRYRYKLEGLDREWTESGTRNTAYYTNIPPGRYLFKVMGSNNDGVWNEEAATLSIMVRPPLWKTWWAYTLYAMFLITATVFVLKYFRERRELRNEMKLSRAKAEAREQYLLARNNLFTNFSHELRTPLTLILAPLEDILRESAQGEEVGTAETAGAPNRALVSKETLESMKENAARLMRIVNNLMDFQKSESGRLELRPERKDFGQFARSMVQAFYDIAALRRIKLVYECAQPSPEARFDMMLMEKVFFNLISNALKNTPQEGTILVSVTVTDCGLRSAAKGGEEGHAGATEAAKILVEIKDSGPGIPAGETEKIFMPFYQVAQNEHSASGTGLGLSLSRSIVELHGGTLSASNAPEGGAVFILVFPADAGVSQDAGISIVAEATAVAGMPAMEEGSAGVEADEVSPGFCTAISPPTATPGKTILVAEDNTGLRKYIVSRLAPQYTVIEAANGQEALKKALARMPDLIITDIMMPGMDGNELTRKLKNDLNTSHIPIIMLTAKIMENDRRTGYEAGADAYITKPFGSDLLLARVSNIIHDRERLKEIYGKRFTPETLGVDTTSLDEKFINKIYALLEERVSDPTLSLDSIAREMGMSRANFYRKVKALTSLAPGEFVRNFRLHMGARLLRESDLSVSEIYVIVGFSSHAYFTNCFRALYGVSPKEYAADNKQSPENSI